MTNHRLALQRLASEIALFCATADPTDVKELEVSLGEQRHLINLLELRFAQTAGNFAVPYEAQNNAAGLDEETAAEFMRRSCHMTAHAARTALNVSKHGAKLSQTITAVRDGDIGMSHLAWMASTAETVASKRSVDCGFDEKRLLRQAKRMLPQQFRRQCENYIHENDRNAFKELHGVGLEYRELRISKYGDGCVQLNGFFDPEGGAAICAALSPYADRHGADDYRVVAQRNADALVEASHVLLDSGVLPSNGGQKPHLHVTTTLETLRGVCGAPAGELANGALLASESVSRLACDATMVRVLLNSESKVIDVGRAQRVVQSATRRALNVRDRGCVWPGCSRNSSRTQAHHLIHWTNGGRTDLENLVLLCRRHHWMVHEGGYEIVRSDEGEILCIRVDSGDLRGVEMTELHHTRDPALAMA